jgi:beta-xylosidase
VKSTGIVTGKYDTVNAKWLIEKDIENSNQYLVQTEEVSGEKILVLKTDGLKNLYQNFTFRSSFNARRGNACGLIFKYQNGSNYLRLQCKNGRISFVKRVAGVDTVLGEEMAFIPNVVDFYHLKIECDSNNFKYYYSEDGAIWILIDEVTTSDFTEGQIGVFSEGMLLRINELFVYEHNQGGDTFYELFYDDDGNVSSIIKKPTISL